MLQKTKRILGFGLLVVWDAFSMIATIFLSSFLMNWVPGHTVWWNIIHWPQHMPQLSNLIIFSIFSVGGMLLLNVIFGNYSSLLKHFGLVEVFRSVMACVSYIALFHAFNLLFLRVYTDAAISFSTTMAVFLIVFQLSGRSSVRVYKELQARIHAKQLQRSGESVKTLIFGAGEAGAYFCAKHKKDPCTSVRPVVFVDDDASLQGTKVHGVKVYGGSEKLEEAIEKFEITEVIVAIPTAPMSVLKSVFDICRKKKCKIRRFGNVDDIDLSSVKLTNINLVELLRRDKVTLNMDSVKNFVENKMIVVTGGAGSIGSEICRQVLFFGCKHLVIFDIHENGLYDIEQELKQEWDGKFSLRLGSVRDKARVDEVFEEFNPDIVFHAAAHKHVPMMEYSPKEAIKNNVRGTINVALQSIIHNVEKFILISTDKAVNPTNIMGASKRIAEQVIQLFDTMSDTDLSAVRFGNVLGSTGSVVPLFKRQIEEGGPVTITHPEMKRYFMTIPESVQLVLEAGAMADGGEIFVLNMGEPVRIYDLACDLIRLSGLEPEVDIEIVFTGLRPGEKLFEEISMCDEDVTKTRNKKIFIMKPMEFDSFDMSKQIKELEKSSKNNDLEKMFESVKKLVPTFEHNNSEG